MKSIDLPFPPFRLARRLTGDRDLERVPVDARGISLVEALVAAVVLVVVSTMAISVFNNILLYINRTGQQASLNAVIDADLARIKQVVQAYNACSSVANGARGSTSSTGCGSYGETNSYYYFPDPARSSGSGTDVATFEAACGSTAEATHITKNFMTSIAATSSAALLSAGITKSVSRQDGLEAQNNNVVVTYSGPRDVSRTVLISPYLSYWCP